MSLTIHQRNRILKAVYDGRITSRNLPANYYRSTAREMMAAAKKGFGVKKLTVTSKRYELLSEINENAHMFSAAKTYQIVRELNQVRRLTSSYGDYREAADKVYKKYSETWQRAEVEMVEAQAMNIQKWEQIMEDKDVLPNLRFSTAGGKSTCDICWPLHDIVRPIDDSFWKKFSPQLHFACMCILIQEPADVRITPINKVNRIAEVADTKVKDFFKTNVGETKQIFNKNHPYFQEIPKKDLPLARRNFNLPIPELRAK